MKPLFTALVAAVGVAAAFLLTSCAYDDSYYGYGGSYSSGPGYAYAPAPSAAYGYYDTPAYAPRYRSAVYEDPYYYRSRPSYSYAGGYNNYRRDYRYGGGGSHYYNRGYNESSNRYKKATTYRRDYRSNDSPGEQRKDFVERSKDRGKYNQRTENSVEKDRDKEYKKDHGKTRKR